MAAGTAFMLLVTIVAQHLTKAVSVPVGMKDEVCTAYKFKTGGYQSGRSKAG